jgi:hypothetical protein
MRSLGTLIYKITVQRIKKTFEFALLTWLFESSIMKTLLIAFMRLLKQLCTQSYQQHPSDLFHILIYVCNTYVK